MFPLRNYRKRNTMCRHKQRTRITENQYRTRNHLKEKIEENNKRNKLYLISVCIFEMCHLGISEHAIFLLVFFHVTKPQFQHWHYIWLARGRACQRQKPIREYKLLPSLQSSNVITIYKSCSGDINCHCDCIHLRRTSEETRVLTTKWFVDLGRAFVISSLAKDDM